MPPIPGLRFWNLSIKFDHSIIWKGLCLVLSYWRVTWISLLECFCKSFIFPVPLLLKEKILKWDFWKAFFKILHFQSLETMTQLLFKSLVQNEIQLKKLTEVSNYCKFISNIFGWDTVKIEIIRAKVQFSAWI